MKVHKPSEIPAQPVNAPLFTGGPVTRQTLLTPEASNDFNLGIVNFSPGARNKMHTHSSKAVRGRVGAVPSHGDCKHNAVRHALRLSLWARCTRMRSRATHVRSSTMAG